MGRRGLQSLLVALALVGLTAAPAAASEPWASAGQGFGEMTWGDTFSSPCTATATTATISGAGYEVFTLAASVHGHPVVGPLHLCGTLGADASGAGPGCGAFAGSGHGSLGVHELTDVHWDRPVMLAPNVALLPLTGRWHRPEDGARGDLSLQVVLTGWTCQAQNAPYRSQLWAGLSMTED